MNKTENIIQYPGIGRVRYVRNRRAKNLAIRINRQGEVRVTVPGYISQKRAESFLLSKHDWIVARQDQMKPEQGRSYREGDILRIRGRDIPVELKTGSESPEEAVWRILLEEAKAYLPGRVEDLAREHGFKITGIKIRKMKSRWGSCTARQSINLNSWLVMLPGHLSDYVILHELVHTRHKDHGRGFWKALDSVTGGSSKELQAALRKQQIMSVNPK